MLNRHTHCPAIDVNTVKTSPVIKQITPNTWNTNFTSNGTGSIKENRKENPVIKHSSKDGFSSGFLSSLFLKYFNYYRLSKDAYQSYRMYTQLTL